MRAVLVALALSLATPVVADPSSAAVLEVSASCLTKQLRKQRGAEAQRASALQAHFKCFPVDAGAFSALFGAGGPLAAEGERHLELLHAARPLVGERKWCAVAVGVLLGGERDALRGLHADLLVGQAGARPNCVLDELARRSPEERAAFWTLSGAAARTALCTGRAHPACD
jgi:hypothetical protein